MTTVESPLATKRRSPRSSAATASVDDRATAAISEDECYPLDVFCSMTGMSEAAVRIADSSAKSLGKSFSAIVGKRKFIVGRRWCACLAYLLESAE